MDAENNIRSFEFLEIVISECSFLCFHFATASSQLHTTIFLASFLPRGKIAYFHIERKWIARSLKLGNARKCVNFIHVFICIFIFIDIPQCKYTLSILWYCPHVLSLFIVPCRCVIVVFFWFVVIIRIEYHPFLYEIKWNPHNIPFSSCLRSSF